MSYFSKFFWDTSSNANFSNKKYDDIKLGWIKDNYTEHDKLVRPALSTYKKIIHHPMLKSITGIDLRNKCPPVYDQGNLGSCTANSICAAYEFEMLKQNEVHGYEQMSRLFLYYMERSIEGTIDRDSGAQIKDGISVVTNGLCLESLWPYDISKFAIKPDQQCYDDQKLHKTIKEYRVQQNYDDIKQCLLDGYPIMFGFIVYESFKSDQVTNTGIVPMPSVNEKTLGGHAVLLVGITNINNIEYYIVRNSWGTEWGDGGYFYMPCEYVENSNLASDFWTIQLVKDDE